MHFQQISNKRHVVEHEISIDGMSPSLPGPFRPVFLLNLLVLTIRVWGWGATVVRLDWV